MKDTQQYRQTLDGQYLDGIGAESIKNIIKSEWKDDLYKTGHCVSPADKTNCTPKGILDWVADGKKGQGTQTCEKYNYDGTCYQWSDYKIHVGPDVTYPNAPVLTTQGTCYYAGLGSTAPFGHPYNRGIEYHNRYVNDPNPSSLLNTWNDTGGTAYGMLDWHPEDNSNQITRALDSVLVPSSESLQFKPTNKSFDLSQYKSKCRGSQSSIDAQVKNLKGVFTPGTLSEKDALTLTCPVACPYDASPGIQTCMPRAVCGDLNAAQKKLGLVNYETTDPTTGRLCPLYCPASAPTPGSSGEPLIVNKCKPQSGLHRTICPPMGINYSLVGRNLGMIESPKQNSAFFHNSYMSPLDFEQGINSFDGTGTGPSHSQGGAASLRNIFTSIETIASSAPGGEGVTGFDSDGFYQMPQGVNEAEPILCEYLMRKDPTDPLQPNAMGSIPNFIDILTDPRQVAWMWEGTVESELPAKDLATGINTLGLYIRGKSTKNPQKIGNFNPNTGSISSTDTCSIWQDQMIDICMNNEVQNPKDCFRPPPEVDSDPKSSWAIRYPLDIPPETASPSTNTYCPILMSRPMQDVWQDYHGMPKESAISANNSEYYTGKYCKNWYHYMADTYNAFVDKGANIASEKFNIATTNYCHKQDADGNPLINFNFECGCINADPNGFRNNYSSIVGAMMQGGPESLAPDQKYCYLGACDVGNVGSMQHDRLLDPRYGNWSYPQAPVIQQPNQSPCSFSSITIPCISPSGPMYSPSTECWILYPNDSYKYPLPVMYPTPPPCPAPGCIQMCPTPLCSSPLAVERTKTFKRECHKYSDTSLQKCPNLSCEELIMVEGSTLENDDINSGISICQRHGTNVNKRWKYDAALNDCTYAGNPDPNAKEVCDANDFCKPSIGNTNDPYFFPTRDACKAATNLQMYNLPRTGPPPPSIPTVFTDSQMKWSCNDKECISALGVGEYTSQDACKNFCGHSFERSSLFLIIIILVGIGIFVAFVIFAFKRHKKTTKKTTKETTKKTTKETTKNIEK